MKQRIFLSLSLLILMSLAAPIIAGPAGFSDVADSHPYKAAIDYVQGEKIVNGYPDGTFKPDNILNRAEFTKIIISSRYPEVAINGCVAAERYYKRQVFTDIDQKIWFESYVCQAKKEGIIGGYADGSFKPTNTIIFAEAAKITVKSYGLKGNFTGEPWFAPYMKKLEDLGAVPDSLSKITNASDRAVKQMTRAEMADIIYRLRKIQDEVRDPENAFRLRVPELALSDTVKRESIKISKIPKEEHPIQEVSGAPMVFYRLEPPGTKFNQAISFDIEIPTVGNAIPMIFFVSGDNVEMIPTPIIEVDPNNEVAFLTAKIEHFSGVGVAGQSPIEFEMQEGPSTALEDEPFTAGFTITWNQESSKALAYESDKVKIRYGDRWTIFGVSSRYSAALIPSKTDEFSDEGVEEGLDNEAVDLDFDRDASDPDAIIISDIKQFFHNETFECAVPKGAQRVHFTFNIGWNYVLIRGDTEIPIKRVTTVALRSAPFRCVSADEDNSFMGDFRCAGITPVTIEENIFPLEVVQPPEDVNCYLRSDVDIELAEESNCDDDHVISMVGNSLESFNLDRTPKKIIDPDQEGCHYGLVDDFSEGIVFLNPPEAQKRVDKLLTKNTPRQKFRSFDGVVTIDAVDEESLQHPLNACTDTDPFDIDEADLEVSIQGEKFEMAFLDREDLPELQGKIAQNGLVYAEDKSLLKVDSIFIGKLYLLDDYQVLRGSLRFSSKSCQANAVITIEEL